MSTTVSLEEAAKKLGMSTQELNQLRLKNEIPAVRDGNDWKFKLEELERYADEQGIQLGGEAQDSGAGQAGESGDVLGDDEELSFGSSDIKLAAESSGNVLSGDEESGEKSPSDTDKMGTESEAPAADEEELFEDDMTLQESASFDESADLADLESSDLVLDDSDSDSEVDIEAGETGVNLGPTDSGISLEEEPLELGGSDIDSLELPEDEDVISLEDAADSDSVSELESADDDFNLTPLEDSADDDMSSGSQVIALEDSAIYTDDSAPTMLDESEEAAHAPVADTGYGPQAQPGGTVVYTAPPQTTFATWEVVGLFVTLILVTLLTLVTIDLARNMWQPSGVTLSNSIVNFFVRLFGYEIN